LIFLQGGGRPRIFFRLKLFFILDIFAPFA